MATLPDDFFTIATFGTLAGCVGVTTLVTAGIQKTAGWSPARTGLVVAFLVVLASLFLADKITDAKSDVVGFFNAFLVFGAAAGISDAAGTKPFRGAGGRPLFRSWFP